MFGVLMEGWPSVWVEAVLCSQSTMSSHTPPRSMSLMLQQFDHVLGNPLFQFPGLGVESFQLLVLLLQPFLEIKVILSASGHAHIAARVEAPALSFDLGQRRHLA